jgi:hypothetical protein
LAEQKPTGKTSSRRVGLPKSSSLHSSPPSIENTAGYELPTDLSALANILEAAMSTESPARATGVERRSRDRAQVVNSQLPTPASAMATARLAEAPSAQRRPNSQLQNSRSHTPANEPNVESGPATRSGETSQREAAAFDEVARSLAAAEACVPLLAQSTGLLRIAALDVVKAETARAGGLLQLLRFLRGDIALPMTAVSTSAVVLRVVQALESERRLRSIALTTRSSVADATCAGDETLLANTLLALLLITFAALDGVQNARVMLSVNVSDDGEIGLAVSQDHVAAPAAWTVRIGSDESAADASQAVAAIALNAAHRLVREWHGRFAVASGEHSSILTIWLPAAQPREVDTLPH